MGVALGISNLSEDFLSEIVGIGNDVLHISSVDLK